MFWRWLYSHTLSYRNPRFRVNTSTDCHFIRVRVTPASKELTSRKKLLCLAVYWLLEYLLPKLRRAAATSENRAFKVVLSAIDLFNFSLKFRCFDQVSFRWIRELFLTFLSALGQQERVCESSTVWATELVGDSGQKLLGLWTVLFIQILRMAFQQTNTSGNQTRRLQSWHRSTKSDSIGGRCRNVSVVSQTTNHSSNNKNSELHVLFFMFDRVSRTEWKVSANWTVSREQRSTEIVWLDKCQRVHNVFEIRRF